MRDSILLFLISCDYIDKIRYFFHRILIVKKDFNVAYSGFNIQDVILHSGIYKLCGALCLVNFLKITLLQH